MDDWIIGVRANVDWERFPQDPMFRGNTEHYGLVGESALRAIVAAHLLADKGKPLSILDFACATGRVTRWLRAAFPEATIDVADVREEWVNWSARKFAATGWLSMEDISLVTAPRQYDLIWSGSLATHISADKTRTLLGKFYGWLAPGGICVTTTHGRKFVANLLAHTHPYFPEPGSAELALAELATKGYGYVPHPGRSYGISVNSIEWLVRLILEMNARLISISESAWDKHQDVTSFQKAAS